MRFTKSSAGDSALSKSVVNVHTVCLKDIEELTFSQKTSESQSKAKQQVDSQEAPSGTAAATKDHLMEVPIAGQQNRLPDHKAALRLLIVSKLRDA